MAADRPVINLVPALAGHFAALMVGHDRFEREFGWRVQESYLEFPEALPWMHAEHQSGRMASPWCTYLLVALESKSLIGLAGFKGVPVEGMVEIGYGIARAYRNRGIATDVVGQLLVIASTGGVRVVEARTLPEPNASTTVLERSGFAYVGVVNDPNDGPVFLWRRLID